MKLFEKCVINNKVELRFWGLSLLQYGLLINNKGSERFINLFPKSYEHRFLDRLIPYIDEKYDYHLILRAPGLGESFMFYLMLDNLIKKNKIKNYCILTHSRNSDKKFLFGDRLIITDNVLHGEYNSLIFNRFIKYKGRKFQVVQSTSKEIQSYQEKNKISPDVSYPEQLLKWAGVKEYTSKKIIISEEDKNAVRSFISDKSIDLKKLIYIIPEANSVCGLSKEFWTDLIKFLFSSGYEIFVNPNKLIKNLGYTYNLNIPQALYLMSLSYSVISIRCGLIEMVDNVRHVLYTNEKYHNIQSSNHLKVYSLKKYPNTNNKVFEYDSQSGDSLLIDQIMNNIINQNKEMYSEKSN